MSGERIRITGGRVIDPANDIDGVMPVCVADGRVLSVGAEPDGFQPDKEIAVPGNIVCPGFIDLSVRMREPGQEHKATVASETAAAIAAGVTTACCPPDTHPVIDTPAMVNLVQGLAAQAGQAQVLAIGALTRALNGKDLSEMNALKAAGCVAVSNASAPVANMLVWRRALEYAASYDLLVIIRPEDPWLRDAGCAHEGAVATRLGLPGIPETAETVALAQTLALIEAIGVRTHFGQLSCARAVEMIAVARQKGLPVSADVAAHQLHLTEADVDGFNAHLHVVPPLRTAEDRDALRIGVAHGDIAAICSDHQPHEADAKLNAFPLTESGISSLETMLPLTLRLTDQGILDLSRALARLTVGPAGLLGIESGKLSPGTPADICIFDPALTWTPNSGGWRSRGRNTPFWSQTLRGRVTHTLVRGRLVFTRG
jgi:dihydroorotase